MNAIVWQYSIEWQREMGIFDVSRPPAKPFPVLSGNRDGSKISRAPADTPAEEDLVEDEDDAPRVVLGDGFVPALTKLEAVNRLSALSGGGGESLGPGSTERKSVLVNIARALRMPAAVEAATKPELGAAIAERLDVPWDESCWSRGSTVTLEGLNRLLHGASRVLVVELPSHVTAEDEANVVLDTLRDVLPLLFDGRGAIDTMREDGSPNWAKSEWPGWFFEHLGIPACEGRLGGGPCPTPGKPIFDYRRVHIWDLKTHSEGRHEAPLNDQEATWWALDQGGLGFIILSGEAEYDPAFMAWSDTNKERYGKKTSEGGDRKRRRLKSQFHPRIIEAFWFPGRVAWQEAIDDKTVVTFKQGKQPGGQLRKPKFGLKLNQARDKWLVGSVQLT